MSAATLHERLHDEYESLGMLSYHGGLTPDLWWADLTKADIEEIRELLRDAGAAVRALELVAESKGENLLVDGVIYGPSMYAAHALSWKPGQRCQLVDLRKGKVLAGKIEVVRGHKMVVATVDGQRWSADVDSSFVQRPK